MTFRSRLTLTFTALTGVVLVIMTIIIYVMAEQYTHRQFFQRLRERGMITAQMYLEQDEMSARSMRDIQRKFMRSLNEEVLDIYDLSRRPRYILDSSKLVAPAFIFEQIDEKKFIEFTQGDKQGVGFLYEDNEGDFYIIVSAVDATGKAKLQNLQEVLVASVAVSIVLMLILGSFFSGQVLRPIKEIVEEVNNIRASSLHRRVKERKNPDEIGDLVQTFNQMLDRLETSFEMQKSFIANASHELRNPLTAISGEIEVTLLKDRSAEAYKASLETLQSEAARLEKLTTDLISLAQTGFDEQEVRSEQVRIDEVILEVKAELDKQLPGNRIRVDLGELPQTQEQLSLQGSRNLIKIALTNVLENASKFSDNSPVLLKLVLEKQKMVVVVQDAGIGIPKEDLDRVFQPFYRAGNARSHQGSGIGLSMTEKIMKLHKGRILIQSETGKGTEVKLEFPV